jgi:hypothetical protein
MQKGGEENEEGGVPRHDRSSGGDSDVRRWPPVAPTLLACLALARLAERVAILAVAVPARRI